MKTIRIQLSVKQREILQPLFDEAEAYVIAGERGAVLLQAWPSGKTGHADAVFLYPDQVVAFKGAIGTAKLAPDREWVQSDFDDIPF